MYAYEIKQNVSKNFFFAAMNDTAIDGIATVFFLLSLTTAFILAYEK